MPADDARIAGVVAIAHRAGNSFRSAERAAGLGADVIEADVHAYRGRLEVRHLKTLGRVPLLWDRWYLAPGWLKRLTFPELAARLVTSAGPALMIDLKGPDVALSDAILDALRDLRAERRILVCGQNWRQVDRFIGTPGIERLYSVGTAAQLEAFRDRTERGHGTSIHRMLLSKDVVRRLKDGAPFVTTWPIGSDAALDQALDAGVDGITTDSERVLSRITAARERIAHAGGAR